MAQDPVSGLLDAIEQRDLHAMENNVQALRGSLARVPKGASARAEQLDALRGIAEEIERSLRRMRTAAASEMTRIQAAAPLLAHVANRKPAVLTEQ